MNTGIQKTRRNNYFTNPALLIISCALFTACKNTNQLLAVRKIDFPSASAIEYIDSTLFLAGDDANELPTLNEDLLPVYFLKLFNYSSIKIPKDVKADIEASTKVGEHQLLLLGSGSLAPYRNKAWLIHTDTKKYDTIDLTVFYDRLKNAGIKELNIEGACATQGMILLSNRGSKGYPKNHLIVTTSHFWQSQEKAPFTLILAGSNTDTAVFNGISGMTYSEKSDQLLMTVSTEDTRNSLEDGAIGASYLWIINNFQSKRTWKAINPDRIINLEKIDAQFKAQKIESVCITKETKKNYELMLVADNDNTTSTVFKMLVQKD